MISKRRSIVTWFKRHVKANDDMRKLQASGGVSEGKMLKFILDVSTRWNSTYFMIERFIKLISYLSQVLCQFPANDHIKEQKRVNLTSCFIKTIRS